MNETRPFHYLTEDNITRLAYMFILRKEEPWVIAVVATYMNPELARKLLLSLPAELQSKVGLMGLTIRTLTREQLTAIDEHVKANVDFIVDGMERLGGELERADFETRYNIVTYLKTKKPEIYEELRRHYPTFEDLAAISDRDMQSIVRNLRTEHLARALQKAPPGLINHFFSNMSAGAAVLLKESMSYLERLGDVEIDRARFELLDVVGGLERAGRIAPRGKYVRRAL